ncbi:MAG TPA: alpha/beta fold hydrolase [Gemmatimonadaceae bacterium]|jgi:pimeloyl-ACP methyl ester carboxylesterase|nr:alpha/beta fold hydrolase [Gemmatimonadaceae bacterium]
MLASIRTFFALAGRLSPALAGRIAAWLFARPRKHPRPERERELIARGAPLSLPDGLRATAWGAGPAVLLVHGWEGRGAQLGALVDPLVAAGHRVIALDGPAHGDSVGRSTTGPEFAAALETVRQSIGPLAAVVAHSFGGFTSLLAISRGLVTERLVILAAPSSVPEVLDDFVRLIQLPRRAVPAMVAALEARVHAPMSSFDVSSFASAVKIPVLIVHDTDDKEVSYEHGPRLADLLGARLLTTNGLGHRRILFAPEVVTAIVEFVGEGRAVRASVRSALESA